MTNKQTYENKDLLKGRAAHINPQNKFENTDSSTQIVNPYFDEDQILKTRYTEIQAKSIINKVQSKDVPFEYSMNPYQGCEHGCIYCYARNTHNYWGYSAGLDFETQILVKTNAPDLLIKKLSSKNWEASPIMLSGNTDCYQPAEKKYEITKRLLEIFLHFKHPVALITKSALMLRDLDILKQLASHNLVSVAVSINTLDDSFRYRLEPRASSIPSRLKLIKTLVDNGIPVTALAAPMIPGLNDHEVFPLVKELASLGVHNIGHIVVRLNGDIGDIFKDWLERKYPLKKDKVINQIEDLHGGQLSDSRIGQRMKGEGNMSHIIHQQFELARNKYLEAKEAFVFDTDLYEMYKRPQLSLF